jgi:hypothetical protein
MLQLVHLLVILFYSYSGLKNRCNVLQFWSGGDVAFDRVRIGSFKVGNYLPLKSLLISHLLMFYCQIGNKSI